MIMSGAKNVTIVIIFITILVILYVTSKPYIKSKINTNMKTQQMMENFRLKGFLLLSFDNP